MFAKIYGENERACLSIPYFLANFVTKNGKIIVAKGFLLDVIHYLLYFIFFHRSIAYEPYF